MPLTKVQAGLLEATGTPSSTTFLSGDGAWSTPVVAALSTASGSAPSYSARAWVNFNGTGTVAIRGSGNVSSITDNGVGIYTVNFTTAMADVNYVRSVNTDSGSWIQIAGTNLGYTKTTGGTQVATGIWNGVSSSNAAYTDSATVDVVIFR